MNRLSKTGISFGDYAWNFYPGCLHKEQGICPSDFKCWAESLTKRYPTWGNFHEPHLMPERLLAPLSIKKPSRILVNFMGDLMGDWVDPNQVVLWYADKPVKVEGRAISEVDGTLKSAVFDIIKLYSQHTFIFLTKNPAGYQKWGEFPDNCWIGATVCNDEIWLNVVRELKQVKVKIKWLSVEPFLSRINTYWVDVYMKDAGIKWLVVGSQTKPTRHPEKAWVNEIVAAADAAKIPVFVKEPLASHMDIQRQEYPL